MSDKWEWLSWNLWGRWKMKWSMRNATQEQRLKMLRESWAAFIEANKDEPMTREYQDALDAMAAVDDVFGKKD